MNPSNFGYPGRGMPMYPMMGYRPSQPGMQGGLVTEQRDGFQEYGTFAETNGILDPLSAIAFDPCEELVWVGSQTGRVIGYRAPTMQKYTSWRAHYEEVRQFLLNEQGITSISANNIRFYSREGKLQLSYSHEDLQELVCGMWTTASQTTFLAGSRTVPSLSVFDLRRGRVVKEVPMEGSCATTLARNSRQICVGHADGSVSIRDPRSFRSEASLKPHQTHVMALDVKSDLMVTCGYMQRGPRTVLEQMLRVYDLRMMRMLQSIRFDEGAFFIKFHPSLTSTIAAVSPSGSNVQILDVSQTSGHVSHQWFLDSPSQDILCADFSSTGECLAFGDADGYTHLWSAVNPSSHSRSFNVNLYNSGLLVDADSRPPTPAHPIGDSLLSLPWITPLLNTSNTHSIFQPFYEQSSSDNSQMIPKTPEKPSRRPATPGTSNIDSDLSRGATPNSTTTPNDSNSIAASSGGRATGSQDWSSFQGSRRSQALSALDEDLFMTSKVPEPIDPELLKLMRVTSGIGVIATEPGTRKRNLARDIFRDNSALQQVRADLSSQFEEAYDDSLPPDSPARVTGPSSKSKAPRPFRLIPAHHPSGRFGFFDYTQYNRTDYVGLENLGPISSCCNPIIQLLYSIPQLRVAVRNHLCTAEYCTMCELGFLFHMFQLQSDEKNGTRTCSPKNMLRTLEALSKGYFGGLFDEEYESLSSIVEKFNRLLLTRLHEESTHHTLANGKENGPCVIQKLLGSTISSTKSCTSCGSKHVTQSQSFNFKLKRPSVQMDPENTSSAKPDSFSSMLVKTLSNQMQAHSFCEKCDTFQINYVSQEVESLPPHVVVSCCFYGEAGEEAFWSAVSDGYTPARSSTPVDHWIPFYIRIFKEPSASGESSTWIVQEFDKIPPQLEEDDGSIYELSGVISTTKDDEIQHSVAQIRNEQGDQWHLFNDFHVAPCGRMEAVHVSSQWKIPTVIHYTRRNSTVTVPPEAYVSPITPSAFYTACPTPGTDPITRPEQLDELEKVLAIDAEFVLLNEEQTEDSHGGTRIVSPNEFGVARISLIGTRKDNQLERCIMDDYVSHDSSKIVDYLTQFSGIIPGDLDKTTSKHHVITLKEVYLKLRYLVDAGYTFVGHGLSKDFSTINIVVPSKQVIDTVTIYHLENQRMISLRFLASVLLGIDIQQTTHDSIEDSRTALQLYRMHEKLVKEGRFDEVLQEIYSIGRKRLWKIHKSDRAGIASPSPVKASSSVETLAHSLSDQQAPTELED